MNNKNREGLTGLLNRELELFEQVYELCVQQTGLIEEENIEELDVSIGKVQKLREKINGLHQDSEALMQSCVSSQTAASPKTGEGTQEGESVKELSGKIRELVEKCAALNEQNMRLMKEKTQVHTKKIDEQRAKREGIGGYAQTVSSSPELFDKKT